MGKPTVRFRIDFGREAAIGPGKIALLEQIAHSGSLSQAARDLQMSYRRAWLLLDSLNSTFEERVANTSTGGRQGGGAALTAFGCSLVRAYRRFEQLMQVQAQRHFSRFHDSPRPAGKAGKLRLSSRS